MPEAEGELSTKIDKLIQRYEKLITRLNAELAIRDEIINDLRGERKNVLSI